MTSHTTRTKRGLARFPLPAELALFGCVGRTEVDRQILVEHRFLDRAEPGIKERSHGRVDFRNQADCRLLICWSRRRLLVGRVFGLPVQVAEAESGCDQHAATNT